MKTIDSPDAHDAQEDGEAAMVIRWEYYDVRSGQKEPHSIFVEEYDPATQTFLCVNSWGPDLSRPRVHLSDVSRIYLISLKLV